MTDQADDGFEWGLPVEVITAPSGQPRIRFVRDLRDGVPVAELTPGHPTGDDAARLLVERLPGWQAAGEPELGRRLLALGATTERHAYTMAIDTSLAGSNWEAADPGRGLRVVPLDTSTLDPMSLLESQLAAYPAGHPDHDPDVASLLGMLVLMMAGDILGDLRPESTLVLDTDDRVVAGLIINDREGESPAGGAWVSDVWRHPDHPGLGTVLLKRAIAALHDQGVPHLTLAVTEGNPARERYARLGFDVANESLRVRLPGTGAVADRATAEVFYWETWHLQADQITRLSPGLDALRTDSFPGSYAHTCVVARTPRNAAALTAAAEGALAHVPHRYVQVIGPVSPDTVAAMSEASYTHQPLVLMAAHVSEIDDREADPRVEETDEPSLRAWQEFSTRLWQPAASESVIADLVGRRALLDRGSRTVRLAALIDGEIVGSVDLLARGPVAEIDALVVHPEYRGRRLGDALLAGAVAQARSLSVSVLVLSALTNDWPRKWYARRGFAEVGEIHEFMRESG